MSSIEADATSNGTPMYTGLLVERAASVTAAELLQRRGELGVIAEGAIADVLILDADPSVDIAVLADIDQHLVSVMQRGRIVHRGHAAAPTL